MTFSTEQKSTIELARGFPHRRREYTNEDDEHVDPPHGRKDGVEDYETCAEEDGEDENDEDDEVSEYMDEEEIEIEGDYEVDESIYVAYSRDLSRDI